MKIAQIKNRTVFLITIAVRLLSANVALAGQPPMGGHEMPPEMRAAFTKCSAGLNINGPEDLRDLDASVREKFDSCMKANDPMRACLSGYGVTLPEPTPGQDRPQGPPDFSQLSDTERKAMKLCHDKVHKNGFQQVSDAQQSTDSNAGSDAVSGT